MSAEDDQDRGDTAVGGFKLSGFAAVILVALLAAVAQSFGRFTFGVLLPAVKEDLGLSNTLAGGLATANVAAYLAGTLFVAAAASRIRLLSVMRSGLVLAVTGQALASVAPGVGSLGLALVLMGFGGALTWIPAPVVAADAMAPQKRSFAIGLLSGGMGLGVVFAGQLAGYVRAVLGDTSWRTVYVVQCVIAVGAVTAMLRFIGYRQERLSTKGGFGGFDALRRMPGWLPFTLGFTVFGLLYLLVVQFLTTKLEDDSGWTSSRASLAFTLLGVAMIFGGPLFILIGSRIGARRALMIAFFGWAVVATLILPGWPIPTLFLSAAVGLLFAGMPTLFTVYVVESTSANDYGPTFAAATLAFGVAQMVSPQLGGFIADATGSFGPVFLLSAALGITGMLAVLGLPRHSDQPLVHVGPVDWRHINMTFAVVAVEPTEAG